MVNTKFILAEIQKARSCYNYHSCSDSMKEVEAAFCLCGARGAESYLSFVGENNNSQVFDSGTSNLDRLPMLDAIDEAKEHRETTPITVKSRLGSLGFRVVGGIPAGAPKWLIKLHKAVAFIGSTGSCLRLRKAAKEQHMNRKKRGVPGYRGEFTFTEKNAEQAMAAERTNSSACRVYVKDPPFIDVGRRFRFIKIRLQSARMQNFLRRKPSEVLCAASKEDEGAVNGVENNAQKDKLQDNAPSVSMFLSHAKKARTTKCFRTCSKAPLVSSSLEFKSEMMDLVVACRQREQRQTNDEDHDNEFLLLSKNCSILARDAYLTSPLCARHDLCADVIHLFANTEHFYKFDHLRHVTKHKWG